MGFVVSDLLDRLSDCLTLLVVTVKSPVSQFNGDVLCDVTDLTKYDRRVRMDH